VFMIKAKLLMYGLTDEENFSVDFYFNPYEVQAVFMADENYISIVLSGQIYELEYSIELLNKVKGYLNIIMN